MNQIISFLNLFYKDALKLENDFNITKAKKWNPQIYLNELYVQVGHVYNVLYSDSNINENKRNISNLGDELSDVILQLINLANALNIDLYEIKYFENFNYSDLNGISILLGQLTEVIMEENDCRFKKNRDGFDNSYAFVKDRIFKLFIIAFKIAEYYNLDMNKEFQLMLDDANGFLKRYKKNSKVKKEYIDIYDSNENHLGYCEKEKAHNQGLWHKVFGCIIINSNKRKVYFQIKNPKYNNINKTEKLEITVGGHLTCGETLKNGVREIKEETGLNVSYEDLIFLKKRKINKKINDNYFIKEFQYFYLLDLKNLTLRDFKNFDLNEVIGFVEVNLNDVLKLFNNKKKVIKAKKIVNNKIINTNLSIKNFDDAFIKDGLFFSLMTIVKDSLSKSNIKKINKLYRITQKERRKLKDNFYFDNGKVYQTKEYFKNNFRFTIMQVRKDLRKNEYLVYLKINYKHKSIPYLLNEEFKNNSKTKKYYDENGQFKSVSKKFVGTFLEPYIA